MAARRGRSPAAANITQQSIDEATAALNELPEKPKTHWSLREAINSLQGTISTALERGYSYQEVADMLGEQGIRISPASLKSYLAASSRDAGTATPRRRRTSAKATAQEAQQEPEAVESVPTPEEEAPAPKKTRGPRTASKTKAPAAKEKKTATKATGSRPGRKKAGSTASTAS